MAEERVQRRLAAILAADVVGYSRLMAENETVTLNALKEMRAELIDPTIAEHRGRIVKLMGDGTLVEFASVVDAVECAVTIQRRIFEQSAELADDGRITFRIGINLGDVLIEGDDIYGDGVNVATRLESLAEPGGVCISGTVFDQVKDKLELDFDDLGPQTVKNIAQPIRAYQAGVRNAPDQSSENAAIVQKPAVAVLPFDNLSGDPEQEYFSDGLSEDIITLLSAWRSPVQSTSSCHPRPWLRATQVSRSKVSHKMHAKSGRICPRAISLKAVFEKAATACGSPPNLSMPKRGIIFGPIS